VLVTAAFALTLVPGFRQPERSLLSRRDQGTALLVFLVLGLPWGSIGPSMLCGGLAGGLLYRWRPTQAQHPLTGLGLTWAVSWLRTGLLVWLAPQSPAAAGLVRARL
jgi:hypothetical protein